MVVLKYVKKEKDLGSQTTPGLCVGARSRETRLWLEGRDLLVGIDVGTTEVRCAVGLMPAKDSDKIQVLGVGVSPNVGLKKGVVEQTNEVIEAVQAAIEQTEAMIGRKIKKVTVNVNGSHINSLTSRAEVAVSNIERRVLQRDVDLVNQRAQIGKTKEGEHQIQFFPREYRLDKQTKIKDPLRMTGGVLALEALLVKGASVHVEALETVFAALNVKVEHYTVSSLAAWEAVYERQLGRVRGGRG